MMRVNFIVFACMNVRIQDSFTALYWASLCGKVDVVKYLVEQGADPSFKDYVRFYFYCSTITISRLLIAMFYVHCLAVAFIERRNCATGGKRCGNQGSVLGLTQACCW